MDFGQQEVLKSKRRRARRSKQTGRGGPQPYYAARHPRATTYGARIDTKAIRHIVKIRKQDRNGWEEAEAILDLYLHAPGMADPASRGRTAPPTFARPRVARTAVIWEAPEVCALYQSRPLHRVRVSYSVQTKRMDGEILIASPQLELPDALERFAPAVQ